MNIDFQKIGINIDPYVGIHYEKGLPKLGKTLFLSNSTYDTNPDHFGLTQDQLLNLNRDNVIWNVNHRDEEPSLEYFRQIERIIALLIEQEPFKRIILYNFIQNSILGNGSDTANLNDFRNSLSAFRHLLEELKPNTVICCSSTVSRFLSRSENRDSFTIQNSTFSSSTIECRWIQILHPSNRRKRGSKYIEDSNERISMYLGEDQR